MYVVHELNNKIDVYEYIDKGNDPSFDKIQSIATVNDYFAKGSAASALSISKDGKYMVSSNSGDNSVVIYSMDEHTGEMSKVLCLPISGDYPKDACLFPDNRHLVSLNHESDTMTFFTVDLEKGLLMMNQKEIKVQKPNCIIFHKLEG